MNNPSKTGWTATAPDPTERRNIDANKVYGPSCHCPKGYVQNKDWRERHAFRLRRAEACEAIARKWCRKNGWTLHRVDNNTRWLMRINGVIIADWSPSTARLIVLQDRDKPYHAHGWDQVAGIVHRALHKDRATLWRLMNANTNNHIKRQQR